MQDRRADGTAYTYQEQACLLRIRTHGRFARFLR